MPGVESFAKGFEFPYSFYQTDFSIPIHRLFCLIFFCDFATNFYKSKLSVDLLVLGGYNNYAVKAKKSQSILLCEGSD